MSLFGAMTSGVTGLGAQSSAMGSIADNITNVNTVGYKSTQVQFETLVTKQGSASSYSAGGVRSHPTSGISTQGLLQSSGSETNLAISGDGFFLVNNSNSSAPGATGQFAVTRAGSFDKDEEGFLKNTGGYYLQGWPLDSNGEVTLPRTSTATSTNTNVISSDFLETINLNRVGGIAEPTGNITVGANLPANDAVAATHELDLQFFDSLGNSNAATLTFTKTAANQWGVTIPPPPGVTTVTYLDSLGASVANPSIQFDQNGLPQTINFAAVNFTGFTNGAADQTISLNLGTAATPTAPGQADGLTQFGGGFTPSFIEQDGSRFGQFSGVTISPEGIMSALFDNGDRRPIYKLPIATFANPNGLEAKTGNAWLATEASGNPVLRSANSSSAGQIMQSSLEASTVDIGQEFTNMIVVQRAYSASTRIITTADEMLDELVHIKR